MRCLALASALLLLTGCATKPETPAQTVYAMEATYAAALQVAVTYSQLPACPQAALCSVPATVARLFSAAVGTYSVLQVAQTAVTSGASPAAILADTQVAEQALATLTALTSSLKILKVS